MILAVLFLVIALVYSSVGFGGGSSYLALLSLTGLPIVLIPMLSLSCNIVVVSGNAFHYVRAGHYVPRLLIPHLMGSIPMAYVGGRLAIDTSLLTAAIAVSLIFSGLFLTFKNTDYADTSYRPPGLVVAIGVGAILGFLSGLIGIGGGIFLAPVLYFLRAGSPRQIATTAALFILINSVAGLLGQLQKTGYTEQLLSYWYLPIAAFIGGQIGNQLSLKLLSVRTLAIVTGVLVALVGLYMSYKALAYLSV